MRSRPRVTRQRREDSHVQSLTVSSKGQITISAAARRQLAIDQGTHLLEMVAGDCLIYVPEHALLNELFERFQDDLRRADVTAEDILADVEAHREETFRALYPDLAGE